MTPFPPLSASSPPYNQMKAPTLSYSPNKLFLFFLGSFFIFSWVLFALMPKKVEQDPGSPLYLIGVFTFCFCWLLVVTWIGVNFFPTLVVLVSGPSRVVFRLFLFRCPYFFSPLPMFVPCFGDDLRQSECLH